MCSCAIPGQRRGGGHRRGGHQARDRRDQAADRAHALRPDLRPQATLVRVQCKYAPLKDDVVVVGVVSSRYNSSGQQIRTPYTADDVDAIAAYCEALDECYLVPIDLVEGTSQIQL